MIRRGGSGAPPAERLEPVLVVLTGPQVGERVRVTGRLEVGRGPGSTLRLSDPAVGMRHLAIEPTSRTDRWKITDLGAGPTRLDGVPLAARDTGSVDAQDEIRVGDTILRIELHDEVEQEFDRVVVERLHRDDLTGLLSRRKFEHELESLLEHGAEVGPVTLALLDIDRLKRINDTRGHLAGAAVIAHVGRTVARRLGSRGLAARLGGDELAIAMTLAADEALEVVESVLEAVRFSPCEHDGYRFSVTISAGVASKASASEPLFRAADAALLAAKRRGGDLVVVEP